MAISPRPPREARGVCVVNGVLDEVLQEVPRPTASISQEKVPLRIQIPWTNVPEQEREEVLDQELEMDLAIQEHLFPEGGEVSHSQHITVSGPVGTRVRDLIPECYLSGMVHSRILCHGLQDNKQMCLKFQFLVTLGQRTTQMMCTHTLSRERVRSTSRSD